jgi:hypothetical protein
VAGVCFEETGFRRELVHCLRFEKSAGGEDAERPEVHSQAEPGNEEKTCRPMRNVTAHAFDKKGLTPITKVGKVQSKTEENRIT